MKNKSMPTPKEVLSTDALEQLLSQEKIEPGDLKKLSPEELKAFNKLVQENVKNLTDTDKDAFMEKIDPLITDKTEIWEYNNAKINRIIAKHVYEHGTMPSRGIIADETGLSRNTIYKHLKNHKENPAHQERTEAFDFMTQQVLSLILKSALSGDLRAAKQYLDAIAKLKQPSKQNVINKQNNYIQINNTVLSQHTLQQLKPADLIQIEQIVQRKLSALPVAEDALAEKQEEIRP